jgi:putative SOS response-associated peptidase YedK
MFGLVPHWATDTKIARSTYNARTETIAEKPSFREAWKSGQYCIISAYAIYETDWRSGKAVATRIERADGEPMGIAGLWSSWKSPKGETVYRSTMLAINAQDHALMRLFHKPADEKRRVVVLAPDSYQSGLEAPSERSMAFMPRMPAELLMAVSAMSMPPMFDKGPRS